MFVAVHQTTTEEAVKISVTRSLCDNVCDKNYCHVMAKVCLVIVRSYG